MLSYSLGLVCLSVIRNNMDDEGTSSSLSLSFWRDDIISTTFFFPHTWTRDEEERRETREGDADMTGNE